ncbi:transcriptional regulator [Endozoicomonas sp. (ex Bugula neritina AB1)]|nr:transcriptional regulator [Endozoicomonas sp. (ex Bugula neritina AB1)]
MNKSPVAGTGPLARIHQQYDQLRRSEKKVADFVLNKPSSCITLNISQVAKQADVSEPTVMRFCKAIGCTGFQDFRLRLAQDVGSTQEPQYAELTLNKHDTAAAIKDKVFNATIQELLQVRDLLNIPYLEAAVQALLSARRIEFFGFGASGAVAKDAYHKFIRLQVSTAAISDPHMQLISASTMEKGDVIVAISQTGRSKELLHSVKQARKRNIIVIGICPDNTALSDCCDYPLSIDAVENTDLFTPLTSRIVHLTVIDVLATCVAMNKEPALSQQLKSIKHELRSLRRSDV